MPKANHAGATYAGYEGLVVDARDRVSELDPSRNADGSVVDGFESDEREIEDRDAGDYPAAGTRVGEALSLEPPTPIDDRTDEEREQDEADAEDERTDTEREADKNAAESRPAAPAKKAAPAARNARK